MDHLIEKPSAERFINKLFHPRSWWISIQKVFLLPFWLISEEIRGWTERRQQKGENVRSDHDVEGRLLSSVTLKDTL